MPIKIHLASLLLIAATFTSSVVSARPAATHAHKPAAATSASAAGAKSNAAINAYLTRLRGKLLNNWNVPNGKNHVILTTTVNADGTVGDVSLSSTPKSADAEIAGSEAFAKSQPLESLPSGGQAKLTLTFESTADPHGDSTSNVFTHMLPIAAPKSAPANEPSSPAK